MRSVVMEGWRDVAGEAPQAQGRSSGGGDESGDGSSGGVELSLQLRTGSSTPAAVTTAAARRSMMTIFYNGRVCAADVTEIQAREIISMANREIMADQQQLRRDDRRQQDSDSGSSNATARCSGQVRLLTASPAASPRHGLATMAAAPVIDQAATRLSMKRSLQRFLQKRQARTAGAVAPPYAGGQQAQAMRH